MKRLIKPVVVLAALLCVLTPGAHGSPNGKRFIGLWEGVDLNDGAKRTISITDNDGDGVLEVAARDTFWTLCNGDRGLEQSTGTVHEDGVLRVKGVVRCFEDGKEISLEHHFTYSRRQDTIMESTVGST